VIGLSGTPFSPFLGKYYDRLIKPTTIGELIQRGDLSKYEFYAPTKPDLKGVKTKASLTAAITTRRSWLKSCAALRWWAISSELAGEWPGSAYHRFLRQRSPRQLPDNSV
jgi:superfamily II DNA or RNA helicase